MVKTAEMLHFREKGVQVSINKNLPPTKCEQGKGKTLSKSKPPGNI